MLTLSLLGSTGSIGCNTLDVVAKYPTEFTVDALAVHSNIELVADQARQFQPKAVSVWDDEKADELSVVLKSSDIKVLKGLDGIRECACLDGVDRAVFAMSGSKALGPLFDAMKAGKDIAIANKELIVIAGKQIMQTARNNGITFVPIDSEHSAIFQCLQGSQSKDVEKIILTASGGPFVDSDFSEFGTIGTEDALNHPKWKMGQKISIDSATMMNKGLEVLEAAYLYDLDLSQIDVVIHRESLIHSMVQFVDGSVLAQLSGTDMRFPISFALTYPERLETQFERLDFAKIRNLSFDVPDIEKKFTCLALAYEAGKKGGTMPAVLNAANEVAVGAFLCEKIKFLDIPQIVRKIMDNHSVITNPDVESLLKADMWAREEAEKQC